MECPLNLNGDEFRRNSTQKIYLKLFIMLDLLSNEELEQVMGGTSKEEYCATLLQILLHNDLDDGAREGARIGAERAGC
jgi:hypothetical protein